MAFDYKKEYPVLYKAKQQPSILEVPPMVFAAVEGMGDPNEENGSYQLAIQLLYTLSYSIRMSIKSGWDIPGYFEYVVPPLEGFWWMADGSPGVDYTNKAGFCWLSAIRLPEFVTEEVFRQAQEEAARKKGLDCSAVRFLPLSEGYCVQCLHTGPYDTEPESLAKMDAYAEGQGWQLDFSPARQHHEIYLSDPRRTAAEKLKTILRHPIRK